MKLTFSIAFTIIAAASGFAPNLAPSQISTRLFEGRFESIEFKIFPDGRVEQIVQGVKGEQCLKVTEEINAALGEVVHTQPTEEMFQAEVEISEEVKVTNSENDYEGSSSW